MATHIRTKNTYWTFLGTFLLNDIDITCPKCNGHALVKNIKAGEERKGYSTKLVCIKCGYNKEHQENGIITGIAKDPYFREPLWFTINCAGNILWAYNKYHLDFLRQHVEATLRERNSVTMSNYNLGSRLPKWMTAKKNRHKVLHAIQKLQEKVAIM